MVFLYVLELKNNKYYVGKTLNPNFRLDQHFNSGGSAWTKKYKPVNILELISNCDNFDEDKYTLKYMEKYGINNVRGGSFCEIKLNDNNIITLNQIINSVTDKCYICGNKGHYANDCKKESIKKEKIPIVNLNEKCDCPTSYFKNHRRSKCLLNNILSYFYDEDDDIDKLIKLQEPNNRKEEPNNKKEEHNNRKEETLDRIKNIQETLDIIKNIQLDNKKEEFNNKKEEYVKVFYCNYCDKELDTLKGIICHENLYCKNKKNKLKNEKNVCYRCGRDGHYRNDCYASKHISGKYLN